MLTPVEIQSKVFKSGGLGYDKKDVDSYMKDILRSYEDVYRENMELKDRVAVLNEGIQHYKSIEKTLQKALMLAEKTAEETRAAANKEAKRIEKEATLKANIMLADAKNELSALHQKTVEIVQQYERYKTQFRNLANAQKELLDSEAFNIHIERLEAFSEDSGNIEFVNSSYEQVQPRVNEEVSEIVDDTTKIVSSEHLSDYNEQSSEYEFSDFDVEGQEEFDFVDLNDSDT